MRVPPYRVPEVRRNAIQEEVGRMLRLRVIEESRSAWSSPVILVHKLDGTFRFCNDFRRLNEVSDFDAYPIGTTGTPPRAANAMGAGSGGSAPPLHCFRMFTWQSWVGLRLPGCRTR